tara:strand:- start:436 stop:879 length:444 start_codon:yes stop_codon:yes gene_type:complete
MATRSVIAKIEAKGIGGADDTIKAIYCHNDGYLSNNGKILDLYYTDNTDEQDAKDKINELLAGGDISSLRDTIADTTFYMRDRGESNKEATTLKDESALLEFAFESCDAEVVYMYAYGAWYVYDNSNKIGTTSHQFIELEEALYVRI